MERSGEEWGGLEMSWKWGGGETSEEEGRRVKRSGEEWGGVGRWGDEWR